MFVEMDEVAINKRDWEDFINGNPKESKAAEKRIRRAINGLEIYYHNLAGAEIKETHIVKTINELEKAGIFRGIGDDTITINILHPEAD